MSQKKNCVACGKQLTKSNVAYWIEDVDICIACTEAASEISARERDREIEKRAIDEEDAAMRAFSFSYR